MRSPELLTVSLCRGVWLCWAGRSCLSAPGTLLSWGGGIWGTLRVGDVHGGVKTWVHIAGAGRRWVGRCTCGKHTHTPRPWQPVQERTQTLSGTRTEQLSNHCVGQWHTQQLSTPGWGTNPRNGDSAGLGHSCGLAPLLQARARWWSRERGLSALNGTRRAPGRDGNEPPAVRTAQRSPLGWAETFPAPRHNVCKYQRPLVAGPPAGRARGPPSIPP